MSGDAQFEIPQRVLFRFAGRELPTENVGGELGLGLVKSHLSDLAGYGSMILIAIYVVKSVEANAN